MSTEGTTDGLGSLAQAARSKQLNSARGILLFVGVISIAANAVFYFLAEKMVDDELKKEVATLRGQGMIIDQTKLGEIRESAVRSDQID